MLKEHGLDELPLALAKAGSSVHKMRITFARYVELYNQKRKAADLSRMCIPRNQHGFTHRPHRTVRATWNRTQGH